MEAPSLSRSWTDLEAEHSAQGTHRNRTVAGNVIGITDNLDIRRQGNAVVQLEVVVQLVVDLGCIRSQRTSGNSGRLTRRDTQGVARSKQVREGEAKLPRIQRLVAEGGGVGLLSTTTETSEDAHARRDSPFCVHTESIGLARYTGSSWASTTLCSKATVLKLDLGTLRRTEFQLSRSDRVRTGQTAKSLTKRSTTVASNVSSTEAELIVNFPVSSSTRARKDEGDQGVVDEEAAAEVHLFVVGEGVGIDNLKEVDTRTHEDTEVISEQVRGVADLVKSYG
jgi:hypothetical protein